MKNASRAHSGLENQVQRSDGARKRAERRRQAEEELVMFLEAVSTTSSKIADETVSELLSEIGSELLDIEAVAMELVMERIINEQCSISVHNVVREEIRSAMLVYADGSCKCADEVAVLKEELLQGCKTTDYARTDS